MFALNRLKIDNNNDKYNYNGLSSIIEKRRHLSSNRKFTADKNPLQYK